MVLKIGLNGKERRATFQAVKQYIKSYKSTHPCSCGESNPACLTFHHRDSMQKELDVGSLVKMGLQAVIREIKKCEVVCLNCHAKIHNGHD
jgi:hypothetical protein